MPVALISTRTSPAFGPSRSSSTISSGFLAAKATAARVFISYSCFASHGRQACFDPRVHAFSHLQSLSHATAFGLGVSIGLVFVLRRTNAPDRIVGAGAEI